MRLTHLRALFKTPVRSRLLLLLSGVAGLTIVFVSHRREGEDESAPGPAAASGSCPDGMARIPGGTFLMGDDYGGESDQKPEHRVTVRAFCLDRTEVTTDAYTLCVDQGKCTSDHLDEGDPDFTASSFSPSSRCNFRNSERKNDPINCVSWTQARDYCTAQGKRLPTEEEWEYAARGGDEQRNYAWGNDKPSNQLCWKTSSTCEVASFADGHSRWGVQDMTGDVWEWTDSHYCSYKSRPDKGDCGDDRRVFRGGSWRDGTSKYPTLRFLRSTYRFGFPSSFHADDLGFRCARQELTADEARLVASAQSTAELGALVANCGGGYDPLMQHTISDLPKSCVTLAAIGEAQLSDRKNATHLNGKLAEALSSVNRIMQGETGQELRVRSGYRTNAVQAYYFVQAIKTGKGASRPPGDSHHEMGLALDVINWEIAGKYLIRIGLVGGCDGAEDGPEHFSLTEFNREQSQAMRCRFTPYESTDPGNRPEPQK